MFLSWSKEDRDKAIWHHVREKQRHHRCGTRPDEWDPEKGGRRDAYRAVLDVCPGCEKIDTFQANLGDQRLPHGAHIRLVKT